MPDSASGLAPTTLRQSVLMLTGGAGCVILAATVNSWAGALSWVGVVSFLALGLNGIAIAAVGLYHTVLFGYFAFPDAWRTIYGAAIILSLWLACLALFLDGASFGRMTLSGWGAVWRGFWCVAIFSVAKHLTTEAQPAPRFKAYLWSILVVAALMWLGEQGVFSGPPEDDPFDVPEPRDPERANDMALFNYVTYSLAAILGVARSTTRRPAAR